jgi:serine/threonine protein kinase
LDRLSIKSNGELVGDFGAHETGKFTIIVIAVDGGGESVELKPVKLDVRQRDVEVPSYGPNNTGCDNKGIPVDGEGWARFDGKFTCDCSGVQFIGENCQDGCSETEYVEGDECMAKSTLIHRNNGISSTEIGAVAAGVVVLLLLAVAAARYHQYKISMRPIDFDELNRKMIEDGTIEVGRLLFDCKPRELKRANMTLIEQVGRGAFGAVWKATLDESSSGIPEYQVAAKTVLDANASPAATADLMTEAAVMAQVTGHKNLVSIIGVVTSGSPLILVLSYCDHGSMLSHLTKRAAEGNAVPAASKLDFAAQTAAGMAHLSGRHFIHRDLAARNVLLASGQSASNLVCKVADFGLSRGGNGSEGGEGKDEDEAYYRSQTGVFAVRWTAPEVMEQLKFTQASDVWSFGVVIVEMIQDGTKPYPNIKSNPDVVLHTLSGGVHPRPAECDADASMMALYGVAVTCLATDPTLRPRFSELATMHVAASDGVATRIVAGAAGQDLSSGTYMSKAYNANLLVQSDVSERELTLQYNHSDLLLRAEAAEASLTQYEPQYEEVAQTWSGTAWSQAMLVVAAQAREACKAELGNMPLALPNQWESDGIATTSKRYLERIYGVYEGSEGPTEQVASACKKVIETFFKSSNIKVEVGPLKKRERVFEKVLLHEHNFAAIYDYARLALIIPDPAVTPHLLTKLMQVPGFKFVRIKNRLDPAISAYDSGGYRDCQCLVRTASGWVVELQLIPLEIFTVRKRCGHSTYTEQRFVIEARKLAMASGGVGGGNKPDPGLKEEGDNYLDVYSQSLVAKLMEAQSSSALSGGSANLPQAVDVDEKTKHRAGDKAGGRTSSGPTVSIDATGGRTSSDPTVSLRWRATSFGPI